MISTIHIHGLSRKMGLPEPEPGLAWLRDCVGWWTCLVSCQASYPEAARAQPGDPLCNNTNRIPDLTIHVYNILVTLLIQYIYKYSHKKNASSPRTQTRSNGSVHCSLPKIKFTPVDLLDSRKLSPHPDCVPAPPDRGRGEAGKLRHQIGFRVLRARAEGRPEVGVAVVLDPVDHQVVAVAQAGEGGWPGNGSHPSITI